MLTKELSGKFKIEVNELCPFTNFEVIGEFEAKIVVGISIQDSDSIYCFLYTDPYGVDKYVSPENVKLSKGDNVFEVILKNHNIEITKVIDKKTFEIASIWGDDTLVVETVHFETINELLAWLGY